MTDVFSVGTVSVQPGELAAGWIESAFLRDGSRVRIPLIVVHGVEPGPVLWVGFTGLPENVGVRNNGRSPERY